MNVVLDSSATLALFHKEDGFNEVVIVLAEHTCYAHAINLCEVYYNFFRTDGITKAQQVIVDINTLGVIFREDMDEDLWQSAGQIKADYRRISLADCFCAALANRVGAEVITADKEFEPLKDAGVCKVRFIR